MHPTTKPPLALLFALTLLAPLCIAEWKIPAIDIPTSQTHPSVACTPDELARLRAAWKTEGAPQKVVAAAIDRADKHLGQTVEFPPRGGQHNQWYQCEPCQIALKTLSDTQHQCPKCKKIYTGEPYDDVVFSRKHSANLRAMRETAWAYAITQDEKYAQYAREILLGYAQRYLQYPLHSANRAKPDRMPKSAGHINEQTLGEASMMTTAFAPAYDLIYNSKALHEADHRAIRERLILPMLENIGKHRAGKSNWQTWHNAAMLTGGAVLGNAEWIRRAIADPDNGFIDQMKISVTQDGMWYENSWGYHFYTLSAMMEIVEAARRQGIDLWSHPTLKKMFTIGIQYTMPNGYLPRFGDDVNARSGRGSAYMETAYHAYRDQNMLPFLATSPTMLSIMLDRKIAPAPEIPKLNSQLFPAAGHAILRSDQPAGLAAVMTFGPYGGGHGHFDKLSFVFYAYGQELAVDPGRARSQAYRLPVHKKWYKPSISHNTVLVNKKSQAAAAGELRLFAANERYAAARAICDKAYPQATQNRLIVLTPTYLAVIDELTAQTPARFDWFYHNRGTRALAETATKDAPPETDYPGMEYIQNIKTGKTSDAVRILFENPKAPVRLTLAGGIESQILLGDGVGESVDDRVPLAMITRHGVAVPFAAVLEPLKPGATPAVTHVTLTHENGPVLRIARDGATDTIRIDDQNHLQVLEDNTVVLEK